MSKFFKDNGFLEISDRLKPLGIDLIFIPKTSEYKISVGKRVFKSKKKIEIGEMILKLQQISKNKFISRGFKHE